MSFFSSKRLDFPPCKSWSIFHIRGVPTVPVRFRFQLFLFKCEVVLIFSITCFEVTVVTRVEVEIGGIAFKSSFSWVDASDMMKSILLNVLLIGAYNVFIMKKLKTTNNSNYVVFFKWTRFVEYVEQHLFSRAVKISVLKKSHKWTSVLVVRRKTITNRLRQSCDGF